MDNREKTIDRIKKLLALASNNPNATEAAQAALMAQRLIAENDIKDHEIHESVGEQEVIEIGSVNINRNPWALNLALAIADNFRCKIYKWNDFDINKWKKTSECVFVGYDLDAQAAVTTFNHLYEIGRKLATEEVRRAKRLYGYSNGVRNSFLEGFTNGIRKELERQCHELMLIRKKEVDDYYTSISSGFKTHRISYKTNQGMAGSDARSHGFDAGRDAVRGGRIQGQKALSA